MFLIYYNRNEDIPKKDTINNYEYIFKEYTSKRPTLYEALYQMYSCADITDQKAYLFTKDILDKSNNVIKFNFK